MTQHSPIAPSSAYRRWRCTASTRREALFPDVEDPEHSREGTAVHWGGAEQLCGRLVDVGQIAPNGVVLTDEMVDAIDEYSGWIEQFLAPFGMKPRDGFIEQPVQIPRVHPQSWGTPDFYAWLPTIPGAPLRLIVADLKYGKRFVEVFENPQLIEYAAGVTHGLDDLNPGVEITFVICQPRSYHRDGPVRTWTTTLAALRAHINIASNAAHEALGDNARAQPGRTQCRDCKARHACVELQNAGYAAMDEAERSLPLELPPAALALELVKTDEALALLEARRSGLEQQALALQKAGKRVPGWTLTHGVGRETWAVPHGQIIAVADAMGVDVRKPAAAITPAQARKAGLDPDLVAGLAHRPPGEAKLERVTEERLRRVFGRVGG